MQRQWESQAVNSVSERGEKVKTPYGRSLQATFFAPREDRGGCSRYRAAKMPGFPVN